MSQRKASWTGSRTLRKKEGRRKNIDRSFSSESIKRHNTNLSANYIKRSGGSAVQGPDRKMRLKRKIIDQLLYLSPLSERGEQMHEMREEN